MAFIEDAEWDKGEFEYHKVKNPNGIGVNRINLIDTSGEVNRYRTSYIKHAKAGDTDSIYLEIPDKIVDFLENDENSIVEFADTVGTMANELFPEFVMRAFNCPESRKDTIKTDREAVSDKSLFLTKKRYMMHIIDNEGEPCDKYKTMGLEVKKSDTPKALKRFLTELLHDLIDGLPYTEVRSKIDAFKDEYMTLPIEEIGRPMPSTKLGEFKHVTEKSQIEQSFSYHIKAALWYNLSCGINDRKIDIGEKFYVCYVKHPETQAVALPVDASKTPEWLSSVRIDYPKMWEKAEQKIVKYLTSVGWDSKSRAKTKASGFFNMG